MRAQPDYILPDVVSGEAQPAALPASHPVPGQTQAEAELAGEEREEVGGPHVGDQADGALRHSEDCPLSGQPQLAHPGDPDPAPHNQPVPDSEVGRGQSGDEQVQPVLQLDELSLG